MRDSDWWIRECLIASCWVLWKVECGFSSGHAGSGYSVGGTVCVSVCVCVYGEYATLPRPYSLSLSLSLALSLSVYSVLSNLGSGSAGSSY